jgi:hypothetical protein
MKRSPQPSVCDAALAFAHSSAGVVQRGRGLHPARDGYNHRDAREQGMRNLIIANMAWNALFIAMAASEMLGLTAIHENLPWWFKWWWIVALAGGNLVIHIMQLRRTRASQ